MGKPDSSAGMSFQRKLFMVVLVRLCRFDIIGNVQFLKYKYRKEGSYE